MMLWLEEEQSLHFVNDSMEAVNDFNELCQFYIQSTIAQLANKKCDN